MANSSARLRSIENKLLGVIAAGLALTLYGLFVEIRHDYSQSYVALCDISPTVSCSAAFLSDYGRGFGLLPQALAFRNPVYGLLFYPTLLILLYLDSPISTQVLLGLALLSNIGSLYLAYILAFVLHVACVICISLYIVNFLLLVYSWRRFKLIRQTQHTKNH